MRPRTARSIVPISSQAVAILRELPPVTGPNSYWFPSLRDANRPMSENAITAALRRMGYTGDQMTWHGLQTIASTLFNESLPERRKMMQAWPTTSMDCAAAQVR